MTTTTQNDTQAITEEIRTKVALIPVDGWNQSLVDRLEQFKHVGLWTAAAVHDCIGYSLMTRSKSDRAVVAEILSTVIKHMPEDERAELRSMSQESLRWSDPDTGCFRTMLHEIAAN